MRSGNFRGLAVAIALGAALLSSQVRADGLFQHTIPRETPALDYRTGDVMMAPPIPGGHYTKDLEGDIHAAAGMAFGAVHGLAGKVHGLKSGLHGKLCQCAECLKGLAHGGLGHGGLGHGGLGHGGAGDGTAGCAGCGNGLGGIGSGHGGLGLGHGGSFGGLFHKGHKGKGLHGVGTGLDGLGFSCVGAGCGTLASNQAVAAPIAPSKIASPQYSAPQVTASTQIDPVCGGCLGTGRHGQGGGCGLCGGTGRLKSLFGHGNKGGFGHGGHGAGDGMNGGYAGIGPDGAGHAGFGHGGTGHGAGCGCEKCAGLGAGLHQGHLAGLKGKAHHLLGVPVGLVHKVTHKGEIKYFVGAGGPVPLTPGYVPYVVTTRSPRDFFAFPPFSDQIP